MAASLSSPSPKRPSGSSTTGGNASGTSNAAGGRRVLRPLRRVSRLVNTRSRGAPIAPGDEDDVDDADGLTCTGYGAVSSTPNGGRDADEQQAAALGVLDDPLNNANEESLSSLPLRNASIRSLAATSSTRAGSSATVAHARHHHHDSMDGAAAADSNDWAVHHVERVLRHALLVLTAYLLGIFQPQWLGYAQRLLEWCGVAWITCLAILFLSLIQTKLLNNTKTRISSRMTGPPMDDTAVLSPSQQERIPLLMARQEEQEHVHMLADGDDVEAQQRQQLPSQQEQVVAERSSQEHQQPRARSSSDSIHPGSDGTADVASSGSTRMPHPSLASFYMIDTFTNERIIPNDPNLHILENDLFDGAMLAMIRTPLPPSSSSPSNDHANSSHSTAIGTSYNAQVASYFENKQRRFEFQYQVKLKKLPQGELYFACEVDEAIKLGMVQRAFVGAAMAFMKRMNSSFHFSLTGGGTSNGNGTSTGGGSSKEEQEKVHVGFPVEVGFDRLVVTKPGQPIPKLGGPLDEDSEVVKARKKGLHKIDWNTQDTYTFAVWSAYVDFLDWRVLNLPGIRPFDLVSVIGPQHISLTLYTIPPGLDKHYRCDMDIVTEIELSNTAHTLNGPGVKAWAAMQNNLVLETADAAFEEEAIVIPRPAASFDDDENEEEEAQTMAELGEAMYLRSGDCVTLYEGLPNSRQEDMPLGGALSNGGGFAVLQDRSSSTVVIEKVNRGTHDRRSPSETKKARSMLIKSGDKIMIKLITRGTGDNGDVVKYLSIHRGWWLKWVSTEPTKNGFFTIHTHETEFNPLNGSSTRYASSETQTSYLTLGGTFWLRHQRWSKYEVGVSAKDSPTYGGRMLGLYVPGSSNQREEVNNPDDEYEMALEAFEGEGKRENSWMRPLLLTAQKLAPVVDTATREVPASLSPTVSFQMSFSDHDLPICLRAGCFRIDVPAWIEMANRTDRRRQLLYIVRITLNKEEDNTEVDKSDATSDNELSEKAAVMSVVRLRNGNELAELIRVGRALKRSMLLRPKKHSSRTDALTPSRHYSDGDGEGLPSATRDDDDDLDISRSPSVGALNLEEGQRDSRHQFTPTTSFDDNQFSASDSESESEAGFSDSEDENADFDTVDALDAPLDSTPTSVRKRKKLIGSIAKHVKTGTSKTGKKVVSGSKKVGKSTVRTGKAIINPISRAPVHPKKPPVKEPKSAKRRANRRREGRDHYVVVNRTLKRWSSLQFTRPPSFLAGQLSAPDQSCRTASHILSGMCEEHESDFAKRFIETLAAQISNKSDFDRWFLQGGAIQMGVSSAVENQELLHDCPVARWLWDSHCREEWCGVYESGVYCYAPLTDEPSLVLSFVDIQSVRRLDNDDCSPLTGFSLLAIDTAWRCHYFSLSNDETRDALVQAVNNAMFSFSSQLGDLAQERRSDETELWMARFWQGFQSSAESSLSGGGKGKWAPVSAASKMRQRTILNGRRMAFDLEPTVIQDDGEYLRQTNQFVGDLLAISLSFSFDSLAENPDAFVSFHDATSKLRTLSLDRIDLSSPESVCIFVNLYHCLLQHALLLTVNGPLYKRSANAFMRTTCYEIGGDVFSLAELNNCVIRGNLSRAVSPKPPYIDAPRKSNAYRFYALERVDARVNFVLNTADSSCPQTVPVLIPDRLNEQLDGSSALFVQRQLSVDTLKRVIVLPRVCSVYRNDFGNGDDTVTIMFCVAFLNEADREAIIYMLQNDSPGPVYMKHEPVSEQYHSRLMLWKEQQQM